MKKLLLLILFHSVFVFSQVDYLKLERKSVPISPQNLSGCEVWKDGKPYSGKATLTGSSPTEFNFVEGVLNGYHEIKYSNGTVRRSGIVKNGVWEGVVYENSYPENNINFDSVFFEKGLIQQIHTYKEQKLFTIKTYQYNDLQAVTFLFQIQNSGTPVMVWKTNVIAVSDHSNSFAHPLLSYQYYANGEERMYDLEGNLLELSVYTYLPDEQRSHLNINNKYDPNSTDPIKLKEDPQYKEIPELYASDEGKKEDEKKHFILNGRIAYKGKKLKGQEITFQHTKTFKTISCYSDKKGKFSITFEDSGTYKSLINKDGCRPMLIKVTLNKKALSNSKEPNLYYEFELISTEEDTIEVFEGTYIYAKDNQHITRRKRTKFELRNDIKYINGFNERAELINYTVSLIENKHFNQFFQLQIRPDEMDYIKKKNLSEYETNTYDVHIGYRSREEYFRAWEAINNAIEFFEILTTMYDAKDIKLVKQEVVVEALDYRDCKYMATSHNMLYFKASDISFTVQLHCINTPFGWKLIRGGINPSYK
ncbi:MAG: hypothetical protein H6582_08535 [Crocinitomicaceae bacterium]|nr:hypothetical protein [Crocinitomicaceae bacterium]